MHATQSFTKASKRWRCICSRNSSTASLTTPYMQHNPLQKSQKDGAVSALATPPQPLSPLPTSNTILYESLKKMAKHLLSQFLYSLYHHSLHATNNPLWSLKKMALHLLSQFLYSLSHYSLQKNTISFTEMNKSGKVAPSTGTGKVKIFLAKPFIQRKNYWKWAVFFYH